MADKMKIEVLADGTIKTTTDPISGANHQNAEQFLDFMARMGGGETKRVSRVDGSHLSQHVHDAFHEHTKDGHTHKQGQ